MSRRDVWRDHWVVGLLMSFALMVVSFLPPWLLGVLSVTMQSDLGYSDTQLGLALALFWIVAGVVSPFGGHFADRSGWPLAAVLGAGLSGAAMLVTAFVATGFTGLLAGLVVGGLAYGLCSPTSNLVLVAEVPSDRRGQSFGVKQSAPVVVALIGGLAIPLIAIPYGWRTVYVLAAALAPLVMAMAVPKLASPRRRKALLGTQGAASRVVPKKRMSLTALIVVVALGTYSASSLVSFASLSILQSGVSADMTGVVVASASACAIATRLFAGWWLDRRPITSLRPVVWIMLMGVAGLLMLATGNPVLSVIGVAVSFVGTWGWPPLVLLLIVNGWAEQPGRATGLMQLGAGFGSAGGPLLFGILATAAGYTVAWLAVVVVTLSAAGTGTVVQRRFDRSLLADVPSSEPGASSSAPAH